MSIGREYIDKDGNYWQIETPHYIPPEEAIKNPAYVRRFVSAANRKRDADFFKKEVRRITKELTIACIGALVFLFIVLTVKGG